MPDRSGLEHRFMIGWKSLGGKHAEPEREFRFHPERKWRFDFAWPDHKVAVEVEGGQFSVGRHQRLSGFEADCDKYNSAALLGWAVLRFTSRMIYTRLSKCIIQTRALLAMREMDGSDGKALDGR